MATQENKKMSCNNSLMHIIVILLCLFLAILIFKAGMHVGKMKSNFSTYKTGHHQKSMGNYHTFGLKKSIIEQKKTTYEAFAAEAEAAGMTIEEYKASLVEEKE